MDLICGSCKMEIHGSEYLTEVNPAGGYGLEQLLVCDECMKSEEWNYWRKEHWPNWLPPTGIKNIV